MILPYAFSIFNHVSLHLPLLAVIKKVLETAFIEAPGEDVLFGVDRLTTFHTMQEDTDWEDEYNEFCQGQHG